MKPAKHVIVSVTLGTLLGFITKSFYAGCLCFASGILVDIDHIIEYIIHYGFKGVTLGKVYAATEATCKWDFAKGFKKIHLMFHSAEIAILLGVAVLYTRNIYILAILVGYMSHLTLDYIGNQLYFPSYFIIWRLIKKFRTDTLLEKHEDS